MKRLAIAIFLVLAFTSYSTVSAQELTKEEKKEWKKKMKKMTPEQLKRMYDENNSLKSELSSAQSQLSGVQATISEKDAKVAELTEQVRKNEAQLNAAKKALAKAKQDSDAAQASSGPVYDDSGVVFKVQIGAFRNKDLSKYFDNSENFGGENDGDGVQKITLGRFRDYWEADTFKKYLREMGVNDAWIVPYKDGTRVAMKDVLEGVVQ